MPFFRNLNEIKLIISRNHAISDPSELFLKNLMILIPFLQNLFSTTYLHAFKELVFAMEIITIYLTTYSEFLATIGEN